MCLEARRGGFWSCSACRGANDLPGETESKKKLCILIIEALNLLSTCSAMYYSGQVIPVIYVAK